MDENLDIRIKNLNELKLRVDLSRYSPPKKKGGVNGPISEIRSLIYSLLNYPKIKDKKFKPMPMIVTCSMTKGWAADELYQVYRA